MELKITEDVIYDWKVGLDIPSTRKRILSRFPSPSTLEILHSIFPALTIQEIKDFLATPVDIEKVSLQWRKKLTTDTKFSTLILTQLQTYESNFLDDGNIPIDNGEAERGFKGVAIGRRNSLFSYSLSGARSNAMLYSVIASARANGADVYIYCYEVTFVKRKFKI